MRAIPSTGPVGRSKASGLGLANSDAPIRLARRLIVSETASSAPPEVDSQLCDPGNTRDGDDDTAANCSDQQGKPQRDRARGSQELHVDLRRVLEA